MEDFEILFVDDDLSILDLVEEYLTRLGYKVTVVNNGHKAFDLIKKNYFDIVLTDLNMPGFSGIDLLKAIKEYRAEIEVIIVTGFGTIQSAIEALKLGSYDYIQKPINFQRLQVLIDRIIERKKLQLENILIKKRLKERDRYDQLIGISLEMQKLYEIIDKLSMKSPTVLIQGESGTGKELMAKVIHQNSDRKDKPFIPVNCGAIVEGLLESELFGHVKGAFTGAIRDNVGLFRAADCGTIFLDEITELSTSLQVKLLRALQEKKIKAVGDTRESTVDVRVIAATNRNLDKSIKEKTLRKDLFYRLNVVSIQMPSLKTIKDDIPLLINHFLNKHKPETNKKLPGISREAMDILLNYHWPGNVRQLENMVERAFALDVNETITVDDLPSEIKNTADASNLFETNYNLIDNEIDLIKKALCKTRGNKHEAAILLGINTTTVYRKIEKHTIKV